MGLYAILKCIKGNITCFHVLRAFILILVFILESNLLTYFQPLSLSLVLTLAMGVTA